MSGRSVDVDVDVDVLRDRLRRAQAAARALSGVEEALPLRRKKLDARLASAARDLERAEREAAVRAEAERAAHAAEVAAFSCRLLGRTVVAVDTDLHGRLALRLDDGGALTLSAEGGDELGGWLTFCWGEGEG